MSSKDIPITNAYRMRQILEATADGGNEQKTTVSYGMFTGREILGQLKSGQTIAVSRKRFESILKELEALQWINQRLQP